jgi:hypothetical protein
MGGAQRITALVIKLDSPRSVALPLQASRIRFTHR